MWVVLPGAAPTRAKFFRFRSRLITEDLPTLERPAKATWASRSRGKSDALAAERTNSAFCRLMGIITSQMCMGDGGLPPSYWRRLGRSAVWAPVWG